MVIFRLYFYLNSLFYFENDFEMESKYHHKTVALLLIAHSSLCCFSEYVSPHILLNSKDFSYSLFCNCHIWYTAGLESLKSGDRLYDQDLVFFHLR